MKFSAFVLLLAGSVAASMSGWAQAASDTPGQQHIKAAAKRLAADTSDPENNNNLALAWLARARETASPADLQTAADAVAAGLRLAPNDLPLRKTQVLLLLDQQNYAGARTEAAELSAHTPDDAALRGYLARADIGLGDWSGAEAAAQWSLNLQPMNVPALLIAADIRDHYGDHEGALDLLGRALAETEPSESAQLASIDNKIAVVEMERGNQAAARRAITQADGLFPDYPETVKNRKRFPAEQGLQEKAAEAVPKAGSQILSSPQAVHAPLTPIVFTTIPASLYTPKATGTERVIHHAQARVQANPKDPAAYAALGAAFFQHARETGDVEDFQQAEQALHHSLQLDNTSFAADAAYGTMAEVSMGEHRFQDAVSYAQKALALGSGDVSSFAIIGDGETDMGDYERAATAYARLESAVVSPSQARTVYVRDSRLAYLQFIAGNTTEAIHRMQAAVAAGTEVRLPAENLAWLYFELGEYEWQAGEIGAADSAYLTALNIHPGDYRALAGLGKLRANQGRYAEAIHLYQSAIAVVPMPVFVAELGDLLTRAGQPQQARQQYQLVQYIGLLGRINQVLHNRDLALFYADHDIKLPQALTLARKEFEVRHDVYTWDALAWALYKNGKYQEAGDAMQNALRPGVRDAVLLFHAGMIDISLGQAAQAKAYFEQALAINPHFHVLYADQARQQLTLLRQQPEMSASKGQTHVP